MSATRAKPTKWTWPGALCTLALALALAPGAAPARAASSEPLFAFVAAEGPCGLAVDAVGNFYVSDYYHHAVDVYRATPEHIARRPNLDLLDGPCGLAVDPTSGTLYVNDFHRDVVRLTPSSFPAGSGTTFGTAVAIDSAHPTGVAVNLAGNVYVDDRTHVSVYNSSGSLLKQLGAASLEDGYGIAVSDFPATAGRLYVPDAADDTVKVYDPAISEANPVAVISGPPGGFASLRDAAIAVDNVSGEVYVSDNLQLGVAEGPEATIQVFGPTGSYEGHLKYNIVDAEPPGLAVDNSAAGTQGRVYVTSGNTAGASVYAYGPGSATTAPPLCAPKGACPGPGSSASPGSGAALESGSAAAPGVGVVAAPAAETSAAAVAAAEPAAAAAAPSRHRRVHRRRVPRHAWSSRHRHRAPGHGATGSDDR